MNKRVLVFTDTLPWGRSETFLLTELRYIDRYFEKVSILPFEKGKVKEIRQISQKIDIAEPVFNEVKNKPELLLKGLFNRSMLFRLLKEGIKSKVWKSATKFRIWATHFLVIRSLLSEIRLRNLIAFFNQYDILYFYWGLRWSQIIPFLPDGITPMIIVRFHGSDLYEHTNHGYIPWREKQLEKTDHAVVISETGLKYFEQHYGRFRDKVRLSRMGTIDHGLNPFSRSAVIRIVSCSNLVPVKRVELIAMALGMVKARVEWIHFGDGPQRNEIEKLIASLPDNILCKLAGSISHEDLMKYYSANSVDLFINVSSSEGVPVSIMEAMSFGIPVIATAVGGTPEIVSERTGMLIEPGISIPELALKITEMAGRDDLASFRKAARDEWFNNSRAETIYPPFVQFLHSV